MVGRLLILRIEKAGGRIVITVPGAVKLQHGGAAADQTSRSAASSMRKARLVALPSHVLTESWLGLLLVRDWLAGGPIFRGHTIAFSVPDLVSARYCPVLNERP